MHMPPLLWILGSFFLALALFCFITGARKKTVKKNIDSSHSFYLLENDPAYLVGNGETLSLASCSRNFSLYKKDKSFLTTGTPDNIVFEKGKQTFTGTVKTVAGEKYFTRGAGIYIYSANPQTIVLEEEAPRYRPIMYGMFSFMFAAMFFTPLYMPLLEKILFGS